MAPLFSRQQIQVAECVGWHCLDQSAQLGIILVVIGASGVLIFMYWRLVVKPNRELLAQEHEIDDVDGEIIYSWPSRRQLNASTSPPRGRHETRISVTIHHHSPPPHRDRRHRHAERSSSPNPSSTSSSSPSSSRSSPPSPPPPYPGDAQQPRDGCAHGSCRTGMASQPQVINSIGHNYPLAQPPPAHSVCSGTFVPQQQASAPPPMRDTAAAASHYDPASSSSAPQDIPPSYIVAHRSKLLQPNTTEQSQPQQSSLGSEQSSLRPRFPFFGRFRVPSPGYARTIAGSTESLSPPQTHTHPITLSASAPAHGTDLPRRSQPRSSQSHAQHRPSTAIPQRSQIGRDPSSRYGKSSEAEARSPRNSSRRSRPVAISPASEHSPRYHGQGPVSDGQSFPFISSSNPSLGTSMRAHDSSSSAVPAYDYTKTDNDNDSYSLPSYKKRAIRRRSERRLDRRLSRRLPSPNLRFPFPEVERPDLSFSVPRDSDDVFSSRARGSSHRRLERGDGRKAPNETDLRGEERGNGLVSRLRRIREALKEF